MNAKDVKMINGLSLNDSSNDEQIEYLIEEYKSVAEDYCNQKFDDKEVPSGVKKFIA
ncbi:TPA: phage head-tail adapter protein, partial [Staphylococcus aureus]